MGDVHRQQHCPQESPAGSYSMQTSGSSRPPWDSSSQGTPSLQRTVSIGRPENASGGDTDSPQAVHRSVKLLAEFGHSSYSALFALFWLFLVPNIVGKRASLLSHFVVILKKAPANVPISLSIHPLLEWYSGLLCVCVDC